MSRHLSTGRLGENMAVIFLEGRGYSILEKNWRHRHWEVDIIASTQNILHFIEVKTRRSAQFGYPEEGVTSKKLKNILQAAEEYQFQNPQWKRIQFDILSITLGSNGEEEFFFIEDINL